MKERTSRSLGEGLQTREQRCRARAGACACKASHGEAPRDGAGVLRCGLVQSLQDPATVALGGCCTQSLVLQRRRSALGSHSGESGASVLLPGTSPEHPGRSADSDHSSTVGTIHSLLKPRGKSGIGVLSLCETSPGSLFD